MIQLDIDPPELGRNYVNVVSLHGDAKAGLRMMIDAAPPKSEESAREWTGRFQRLVAEWRAAVEPMRNSDAVPMRPERICKEITETLPDDGVLVSDTGHAGMWSGQMIDITRPAQRSIRCEGSLGWGLPGAMGVKCALPERTVVLFTGDGGLYYHLPGLETAARHKINLVVVVNNKSSLNQQIPLVQAAYKEKRDSLSGEMWRFSKEASLAKAAEALGCTGWRVETPSQLRELLPKAFALGKPVLLDCIGDDHALAPTAWVPGGRAGAY